MKHKSDLLIIGGGIVGLSTAWNYLQQYPDSRVTLVEKEAQVGLHQSGRNSGVLHSGIYYTPGSYRARLCTTGKAAMEQFCQTHDIAYEICGKVIVAVSQSELPGLEKIYKRGVENGVNCELIGQERLSEIEPHVAGFKAIHVPEAGIVDYPAVCRKLAELLERAGCNLILGARVMGMSERTNGIIVATTQGDFNTHRLVSCAGLYSDQMASKSKAENDVQIVPFRGEYYDLKPEAHHLCKGLIYPVPDPAFPFLGVHFTKLVNGGVDCGPNAVLAWKREGYNKTDVDLRELWESITYSGFQKLALKHWPQGIGEIWRSFNKRAFVKALQRLVPEIRSSHLTPASAGVRAQALKADGSMSDDFAFVETARSLHVVNAPSPAATASLAIGNEIITQLNVEES